MSNIITRFFLIILFVSGTVLSSPVSGYSAAKNLTLSAFDGSWSINIDKSRQTAASTVSMLAELEGMSFAISGKNKTIQVKWPDFDPKTHKVTVSKATPKELHCKLDGFTQPMIIETSGPDEILVKDRDETLVFNRVKK